MFDPAIFPIGIIIRPCNSQAFSIDLDMLSTIYRDSSIFTGSYGLRCSVKLYLILILLFQLCIYGYRCNRFIQ